MVDQSIENARQEEEQEDSPMELHRGYVRELDKRFATAYGLGGGALLFVLSGLVVGAYLAGVLGRPVMILAIISIFLVGLAMVKRYVERKRRVLLSEVHGYLEANDLAFAEIKDYFRRDQTFQYFNALLEREEKTGGT